MNGLLVEFQEVETLPDRSIDAAAGPASRAFHHRGSTSVHAAAAWLRDLPYAPSRRTGHLRVFEDGFGDCTSKHAAFIALSKELDLVVGLVWGVYALDASLVPEVEPVLAEAGLPFVPNIHCFLQADGPFIDLTQGNCTGKSRQVERYLALFPASHRGGERPVRLAMAQLLTATDSRFAGCSASRLSQVAERCVEAKAAACAALSLTTGTTAGGLDRLEVAG